jgi:hypothetical protein
LPENLDYRLIKQPLDALLEACCNKVAREWPQQFRNCQLAWLALSSMTRVVQNTFHSIIFLSVSDPQDHRHKPEFMLSTFPLSRVILESIFTTIYMFEDLPVRSQQYAKAGWQELFKDGQRLEQEYGSNPFWTDALARRAALAERAKAEWGITPEEASDPDRIERWPLPGRMLRQVSPENREFLNYLRDWFYGELSQAAHLTWPRLLFLAKPLVADETKKEDLEFFRTYSLVKALTLVLTFLSEVQCLLSFDLAERLKYVWTILNAYQLHGVPTSRAVYEKRFAHRL